jgi:hypothetical protein
VAHNPDEEAVRPPRGYWARVEAGQQVRRKAMGELPAGQGEEIVIRTYQHD